ncbi:MAG: major capsid protein [Clostridium septicum]|uniref:major capsid protein n=1 Tax=Clostridium septicum TaxID=1504 RepID=UPI0025832AAC|nr:major capsid protein [Clostridium septicum]MDU1313931.1 major capsid protein [Clostridium septicum]WLF70474.1 major capsid protein [Clostridium septicum]
MPRLEEVFSTKELINYYKDRKVVPMLGDSLFPERKIQDIEFDMILGRGGIPVSASVHALDTQTELASREAINKGVASLALIKRQIKITEKEIIKINNPRTNAELESTLLELYKDADKMVESVKVRVEAMRMELLSSGKIKIEENGVKVTMDYGFLPSNKKTFNWSDAETSKPLDDLETLAAAVEDSSGSRPVRALTSRKIVNKIRSNKSVREAVHGINSAKTVTLSQLNDLLEELDLPRFVVNEGKYKVEKAKGFDTKRYFPENVISMFGPEVLGETIYGLTAEEVKLIGDSKMEEASMIGNIFAGTYSSIDPVGEFTKAAATALPSCPTAEEIGIATITL